MRKITVATLFCIIVCTMVTQAQKTKFPELLKEGEKPEMHQLDPTPYNPQTDPNADLFINHFSESKMNITAGCLKEWQIIYPLKGNDPVFPEQKGHVATSIKGVNYAVLDAGRKTDPERLSGIQKILYIAFGSGEIVSGSQRERFEQDAMILVPEKATYTIENTDKRSLVMYVMIEPVPKGFKPRADVLVRHYTEMPFGQRGGHWAHATRGGFFNPSDGLATLWGMTPVWYMPMSIGQPHSHNPGIEEIWFVVEGDFHLLLGKQFFNPAPGTAYKVPPTGYLPHSNMNLGTKPVRTFWLMYNTPTVVGNFEYGTLDRDSPRPDEANPNMYISSYIEHDFKTIHSFVERDMLSKNDTKGARPIERGNVLNYIDRFTRATVMAHQRSAKIKLEGTQEVYYVLSGSGTITGGGKTYHLYPGACALVPSGLEFVVDNDNDEELNMYLISEKVTTGFTPNKEILVRDKEMVNVSHKEHWVYDNRVLFGKVDGLSQLEVVSIMDIPTNSFAQPHSLDPSAEEVWATIDSELTFMLGKYVRKIEPGYCYMVPPDNKAFTANYNTTGKTISAFYFGLYNGKSK